jgi:hypothetical protein
MESCVTTDLPTMWDMSSTIHNRLRPNSRAQRVDIFDLTYRNKAKSPHPNQVVKTSLHTFQKHNLFEVDGHARACRPLRRLATNAASNAPAVPKALLQPHFHGASKGDVESRRLERASHLLTAPADSRQRAATAGDNHRSGGRRDCTDVQLENLAYPWSFVAAISKRIAARIEHPVENPAASR